MSAFPTSPKSSFQTERARLLHRACLWHQRNVDKGLPVRRSLQRVSRRYQGRAFRSDPARKLQLSPITLRRNWNAWRRGGRVPSAFPMPKYRPALPKITSRALVRFTEFVSGRRFSNLAAAWKTFCAQPARGPEAVQPRKPASLCQVRRYFTAANFYLLQASLQRMDAEQEILNRLRWGIIAGLQERLPDHLPAKRATKEITFEI